MNILAKISFKILIICPNLDYLLINFWRRQHETLPGCDYHTPQRAKAIPDLQSTQKTRQPVR